jgi:hypothetical protein
MAKPSNLRIEDVGAATARADLNDILISLASLQTTDGAGTGYTGQPTTTYPNMLWYDKATDTLKMRAEADDAWINLLVLNQANNTLSGLTVSGDLTVADKIVHSGDTNTAIRFPSNDTVTVETAGVERIRVNADGTFLYGKTLQDATLSGVSFLPTGVTVFTNRDGGAAQFRRVSATSTQGQVVQFYGGENAETVVGAIAVSNTSTAFNTTSDYRLKNDLRPVSDAVKRVMELNPVNFAWKNGGSRSDGFIAHEVHGVVPEAVSGEKDGSEMQGVDYGKIVPLLTSALQEALREIEILKSRISLL